jgi:lysyl-tRNA synthetase class 2
MSTDEPSDTGEPGTHAEAGTEPGTDAEAEDLRAVRLAKVEKLRASGTDPYPRRYDTTCTIAELRERYGDLDAGAETDETVRIAGRIMLLRGHGKLVFATVRDRSGSVQLFVSQGEIGSDAHAQFTSLFDMGDWIGVEGTVMVTRRGELSVKVTSFQLLAKALRPLPDKWKGLSDVDTRYRQRYVDLVVNEDARRIFDIRFKAIDALRALLHERGFLEVETPVLSTIQGGATAKPFITHYNALDIDTYLRIALELHLKRLIVGGLERVYEIGRVYRNEGIDTRHNPEFTMLEAYQALADYGDMMDLTEAMVVAAARGALGTTEITVRDTPVDLAQPWPRVTMVDLIRQKLGVEVHPSMEVAAVRKVLDDLGLTYKVEWGSGKLTNEIYDRKVQYDVVEPTFVIDHPREVSPLAKAKPDDPTLVERFELIVDGRELANAYSELNDPVDQLDRFEAEARAKEQGDAEAGDVDHDYVRALEYGMPPTGGMGIGVDRLVMILAGVTSIREVILFPTLRPEHFGTDARVYSPDDP